MCKLIRCAYLQGLLVPAVDPMRCRASMAFAYTVASRQSRSSAETANYAMTSFSESQFPVVHYGDAHREAASGNRPVSEAMKILPVTECDGTDHTSIEEIVGKANQLFGLNGWSSEFRDVNTDFVRLVPLQMCPL